jgi:hypothetical protein
MSDHPVGAVRASVGIASNRADLARLMEVLCSFRDTGCESPAGAELPALATVD